MNWLVFTYSLPSNPRSSARVSAWRRIGRLGAVSPRSGIHILPARDECIESLQWLAREVQEQNGEHLVMNVESFEGLSDQQLVQMFKDKADKEYLELEEELAALEKSAGKKGRTSEHLRIHSEIQKLRKKHSEILRIDFFDAPGGARIASRLAKLERKLNADNEDDSPAIKKLSPDSYKNKLWVTRPKPHVDRIACAWLIRRFIDADAKIRYSLEPNVDELAFDLKEGGAFGHVGNLCSFETMITAFSLNDEALWTVAEIVHEIDIRDGRYLRPETEGIESILKGWQLKGYSDGQLEEYGLALFDGLYADMQRKEKGFTKSKA